MLGGVTDVMVDSIPTVRLLRVKDPAAFEHYFAGAAVDIAYVDRIDGDSVDLLLDNMDVRKPEKRDWITWFLTETLRDCGESQAEIQFLVQLQP